MIYKSYLVEKKISLLKDGITLIYGENLGLQNNIKKKILAAKRSGINNIILSQQNQKDILEINKHYIKNMNFHYVNDLSQVINAALLK